jgi:hypothetical protein
MSGAFGAPLNASAAFFGGGGTPTAKFPVIGTTVAGVITAEPTIENQREFGTDKVLTWPDGSPRQQLVVTIKTAAIDQSIPGDDGARRVFIKGTMKTAVANAVKAAGKRQLDVGGQLSITYTGDGEASRPGLNAPKLYAATYAAPSGQGEFLGTAAAPAPAPVAVPANGLPVPVPGQPGATNPFLGGTQTPAPQPVNPSAISQAMTVPTVGEAVRGMTPDQLAHYAALQG